MGPILVFGHRNPDNDSICSAVAYAHLKNLSDSETVYVPARLGPAPVETRFVFERFGVELPEEIAHVRTRVRDVMTTEPVTVGADTTMLEAGELLRRHAIRALPVTDAEGRVAGLLSERVLAERYLSEMDVVGFAERPVRVGALASALGGELLAGDADGELAGEVRLAVREPESVVASIEPGDTLIVGDRRRTQPMALEAGVGALVIVGGFAPAEGVLERARELGVAVITTPHRAYKAARLASLAHSAGEFMDREVLTLGPDTLLSEAAEELLGSAHRAGIVVDAEDRPIGILTRTNLARRERRGVVLVDHNEASQSAEGVEDATVVEIVDHHRVGDIQTHGPILFLNLPVGSTATIVAKRYEDLGVDMPRAMAGILLSAILTDTVVLKSPTTTDVDREVAEQLARATGLELVTFGMEIFRAKEAGSVFDPIRVVEADLKEYRLGDLKAAVGQFETVDLSGVMDHIDEIRATMEATRARTGYDVLVLMLTDIVREGSAIVAVGATRVVERALDISLADGPVWMAGVLSRKKQVAAPLVEAAGR
ncbi:MAG: putative manganese-dependent inorganic diphosphatase [Coriobacteriales bacterium]|nr:putative manganese-dependent inorganic diphosphatase [Coriobacteriales bacterium]